MPPERKLALKRFLAEVEAELGSVRDPERGLVSALRRVTAKTTHYLGADDAVLVSLPLDGDPPELHVAPQSPAKRAAPAPPAPRAAWRRADLADYLDRNLRLSSDLLRVIVPVERRERPWALLALRKRSPFERRAMHEAADVAHAIGRAIHALDERRVAEVRERIDTKVTEKLRPQDVFYQILHGLRLLTHYDHSSALLLHDPAHARLELVAEQVAWRKGRSHRIGLHFPIDAALLKTLEAGATLGFDRSNVMTPAAAGGMGHAAAGRGGSFSGWKGDEDIAVARLLDWSDAFPDSAAVPSGGKGSSERPDREEVLLAAPLVTRQGLLGVFKIAARRRGRLGPWEARVVQRFLLQAAVAIQFLRRTESLELELRQLVKKQAMANVALGVAHDINNAVGAVLPLVQQMIADADGGAVVHTVLKQDLALIEESMRKCRRIAGRMLSFARSAARVTGEGNLRRAIDTTVAMLRETIARQGVETAVDVAADLPLVRGNPGDLEQLVLNLAQNAVDAMPVGGRLSVQARTIDGPPELSGISGSVEVVEFVELVVADNGVGIPLENLSRLEEPFFTTKPGGTGLGLSMCRAIAWKLRGEFQIASEPGRGTRVTVRLPVATAKMAGKAAETGGAAEKRGEE